MAASTSGTTCPTTGRYTTMRDSTITSRGYRAAKTRPTSARALRDAILVEELRRIHAENYSVYGVRKMHRAMVRAGWQIGCDQTAWLMRAAGLQGVRRGRKPITTRPPGEPDARPDLVERRFAAERPHQLWVADITYVRTISGFCLSRFHHRRLFPAHRGMGGLGQPSCRGAAVARPGARPREQRRQPRSPRPSGAALGPRGRRDEDVRGVQTCRQGHGHRHG
ncbi:IS3 family transposase [Micrococcus luteus]|nr:IS3 family transposase [Micrococcus luteus]QHG60172.1 IS3 family transposase [Micrococcus luteus]